MINTPYYFKRNSSILPPGSPKYVPPNLNDSKPPINNPFLDNTSSSNNNNNNNKTNNNNTRNKKNIIDSYDMELESGSDLELSTDSNDSYDTKKSNILWSSESITTLSILMENINNNRLMRPIGHIVRYYIDKHQPYYNEYKIRTIDSIDKKIDTNLDKTILILAYICEIYLKKSLNSDTIITTSMIYLSIGKVIYDVSSELFKYKVTDLSYSETFLINILTEILPAEKTYRYREIITTSYYIFKYIVKYIEYSQDSILSFMASSVVRSNEIDINIFTSNQVRDCLNVLKTKRTLYLRLLLSISEYLLHEDIDLIVDLIFNKTNISNQRQFEDMINDMMIEIIITVTGYIIKVDNSVLF